MAPTALVRSRGRNKGRDNPRHFID